MSGASKAAVAAVEAAGGVVRIPTPKAYAKKPTKRAKRARAGRVFARAMIASSLNGLLTNDGERSDHPGQYNVQFWGDGYELAEKIHAGARRSLMPRECPGRIRSEPHSSPTTVLIFFLMAGETAAQRNLRMVERILSLTYPMR